MDFKAKVRGIKEYGGIWVFFRMLYAAKLVLLNKMPCSEKVFESHIEVRRYPILPIRVNRLELFFEHCETEKKIEILELADSASKGKIKGFSSLELDYGEPIDWSLNPLTGQTVPLDLKWFQIPDFEKKRGDIKVIWEASRFTHFYLFARAYIITKNNKYYLAFSEQLQSWVKKNKYSYGPNYKCGQECSLRLINALMVFSVFYQYGLTTKSDELCLKQLIHDSYKKVKSNFFYAYKCIKNNHTISEICGIIIGAWCAGNIKELNQAYKILDKVIRQQFSVDGGYCQHSFVYQRLVLQLMEFLSLFSSITGLFINEESQKRIINSANLLFQVQNRYGDVPNYGSNDGSLIFPLNICGYRDFRATVNTIFLQLEAKRLYDYGDYDEESIWFSSDIEYQTIMKERSSTAFYDSGYFLLRDSRSFMMITLHNYRTRPAQMDQLHIDMWYDDINVFCDSGSYSYASELGEALQMTEGHNTAKVNQVEQMKKRGPFLIYDWGRGIVKTSDERQFSGCFISNNGYVHERRILSTEYGYKIVDSVKTVNCCSVLFHTPLKVKLKGDAAYLLHNDKVLVEIKAVGGCVSVKPAYISLYYYQKQNISCISIKMKSTLLVTEIIFCDNEEFNI